MDFVLLFKTGVFHVVRLSALRVRTTGETCTNLERLAKAHAVREDAAEAVADLVALDRLHQVVVQEPDPSDLNSEHNIDVRTRHRQQRPSHSLPCYCGGGGDKSVGVKFLGRLTQPNGGNARLQFRPRIRILPQLSKQIPIEISRNSFAQLEKNANSSPMWIPLYMKNKLVTTSTSGLQAVKRNIRQLLSVSLSL